MIEITYPELDAEVVVKITEIKDEEKLQLDLNEVIQW